VCQKANNRGRRAGPFSQTVLRRGGKSASERMEVEGKRRDGRFERIGAGRESLRLDLVGALTGNHQLESWNPKKNSYEINPPPFRGAPQVLEREKGTPQQDGNGILLEKV